MSSSFRKTLTRKTKTGPDTIVDGYAVLSATTDSTFLASVQPLMPQEIEHLPEGRRNSKTYWLYTDEDLNMITANNADQVEIDSELYEVWKKESWQNGVIPHFKILVGKMLED